MLEDWTIYSWYCPNCKTQVAGLKNKKNQIRVICTKCSAEMVRTVVGRRHDVIDIYAPIGMEHTVICDTAERPNCACHRNQASLR